MATIGLDRLIAGSAGGIALLALLWPSKHSFTNLRLHLGPDHPWDHFLVTNIERFALTVFP